MADTSTFMEFTEVASLAGAATATLIISNAIQHVSKRQVRWIAFVVALVTSLILGWPDIANPPKPLAMVIFLIGVNGCLIYLTAVGANTVTGTPPPDDALGGADAPPRTFQSRWYS